MPLTNRFLTAMLARYNGISILVDCGEATQIALRRAGLSPNPIGIMCFTHFHADHISGLPGMLLTMGNADRTEPLLLIGPKGLSKVVSSLRVIAPELPFEVICREINGPEETIELDGFSIEAFKVNHNVTCYGYSIVVPRSGMFSLENAQKLPIDRKYWGKLQNGETVEVDGAIYTPDMVMGPARRGLRVTYSTDTRPVKAIVDHAMEADLLIIEGMYGEPDKQQNAIDHKHMTFAEAAGIASEAQVKRMWLTHFSPSVVKPEQYLEAATSVFPGAEAGKDGKHIDLNFVD